MTVTKKAYAKINLTLEILGTKRGDGFHDIASVMHKVCSLYDEVSVTFSENTGISLVCDKDVCAPEENLAYKAAERYIELYTQRGGKPFGISIVIKKNIPAGAGLAGGSSDAAAVLDGLRDMVGLLDDDDLFDIALSLGSDVPFCLEKHFCALCTGRGEVIHDLPVIENADIAVELPSAPLFTKGIYGEYDKAYGDDYTKANSVKMAQLIENGRSIDEMCVFMCNDFEEICVKRCPEIAEKCTKLKNAGYHSQMSGSGSAVFGIREKGKTV